MIHAQIVNQLIQTTQGVGISLRRQHWCRQLVLTGRTMQRDIWTAFLDRFLVVRCCTG
jgi:hypothetical protein